MCVLTDFGKKIFHGDFFYWFGEGFSGFKFGKD